MTPLKIKDWPAGETPRERLTLAGAGNLSDAELIAILLGRGTLGFSAVDLARTLLSRFGGIRGILNAPGNALQATHGIGPGKAAILSAARECCSRYLDEKLAPGKHIASPTDTTHFLLARLRDRPHEVFCCLFLDNRHRVLAFDELFRGTIDNTTVYPRAPAASAMR